MNLKLSFLIGLIVVLQMSTKGQSFLFFQQSKSEPIVLNFRDFNNLMIMDVKVNSLPMNFIFDTGAENSLVFDKVMADLAGFHYTKKLKVVGSDQRSYLNAYLAKNIHLELTDNIEAPTAMIVLEKDEVNISNIIGTPVYGLLGCSIFSNSALSVDNKKNRVTLIPYEKFEIPKGYYYFPIEILNNRPFIHAKVKVSNNEEKTLRLLLDTGSSISLVIYVNDKNGVQLPEKTLQGNLGVGLGGKLEGYLGLVNNLEFGKDKLVNFPASFQVVPDSITTGSMITKDGIIGNGIFKNYNYVIDYYNRVLYMKPIKKKIKTVRFDRSGIFLVAGGEDFREYEVLGLIPGSPAEIAGLQPKDKIIRFQGLNAEQFTLSQIQYILSKKEGKKINLLVNRNGQKLKITFRLKDLL